MAIPKYSGIKLGPGNIKTKSGESEWFIENFAPTPAEGKDGDVWIMTPSAGYPAGGDDVDIYLRVNGAWRGLRGYPTKVDLEEDQSDPEVALEYPASALPYAEIEYTLRRHYGGTGHGWKRKGVLTVLNNTATELSYSHEFNEIGEDLQCPFTVTIDGGNIKVWYTSPGLGTDLELKYTLRGWI